MIEEEDISALKRKNRQADNIMLNSSHGQQFGDDDEGS